MRRKNWRERERAVYERDNYFSKISRIAIYPYTAIRRGRNTTRAGAGRKKKKNEAVTRARACPFVPVLTTNIHTYIQRVYA